jgi:hypothetical protein
LTYIQNGPLTLNENYTRINKYPGVGTFNLPSLPVPLNSTSTRVDPTVTNGHHGAHAAVAVQ